MSVVQKIDTQSKDSILQHRILEAIKGKTVENPVLQRLRQVISGKTGLAITSYDRMHNRHNRG